LPANNARAAAAESLPIWEDYMPDLKKEIKDLNKLLAKLQEEKSKKRKNEDSSAAEEPSKKSKKSPPAVAAAPVKKSVSKKVVADLAAATEAATAKANAGTKRKPSPAQRKKLVIGLAKRLTQALEDSL
jgi:hypothetical protein